jgi:hypothetical protein
MFGLLGFTSRSAGEMIHVFHRTAPKDFVTQHESTREAGAVAEANLDGSHIGTETRRAICRDYFPFLKLLQAQLDGHVFRDAKEQRTSIGERLDLEPAAVPEPWILESMLAWTRPMALIVAPGFPIVNARACL